jgi:hypothetical protein
VKRTLVSWCLGSAKLTLIEVGIGINIQSVVDSIVFYRCRILVGVVLNWWKVGRRILHVLNLVRVLGLRLLKMLLIETLVTLANLILPLSLERILDIIIPNVGLYLVLHLCLIFHPNSNIFLDSNKKPLWNLKFQVVPLNFCDFFKTVKCVTV